MFHYMKFIKYAALQNLANAFTKKSEVFDDHVSLEILPIWIYNQADRFYRASFEEMVNHFI